MVVVTHDSTVARRAQRIGVMKNGRLTFRQPARPQAAHGQSTKSGLRSPAPGPPASSESISFPD
jgi:ABC-type bacteriocin/lantibiotic exporter with double-glycine peptidase domain